MPDRQDEDRLIEQTLNVVKAVEGLERMRSGSASASGNVVRLEGAGSIWNGLAIGICLGGVMVAGAWIASSMQKFEIRTQQAEAYQKAVYMLAPRFAEKIDEELNRQKERDDP